MLDKFEKVERTRHFGELFLIWIWYHSDIDDTIFYLSDDTAVSIAIDSQMTLEARLTEAERTTLSGGAPSDSPEAFHGLRQGKIVSHAKLRLQHDEKEWVFVFASNTMGISGLKIPALMTKEDDEKIYERQGLIEEVDGFMRGVYEKFLSIRLDDAKWEQESKNLCAWISRRSAGKE